MAEYIDRQAAIDALGERPMTWTDSDYELGCECQYDSDRLAIETVSSADVQPVRHGKWEKKWHSVFKGDLPCCSVCHSFNAFRWDYCPNCGARMDEGSK